MNDTDHREPQDMESQEPAASQPRDALGDESPPTMAGGANRREFLKLATPLSILALIEPAATGYAQVTQTTEIVRNNPFWRVAFYASAKLIKMPKTGNFDPAYTEEQCETQLKRSFIAKTEDQVKGIPGNGNQPIEVDFPLHFVPVTFTGTGAATEVEIHFPEFGAQFLINRAGGSITSTDIKNQIDGIFSVLFSGINPEYQDVTHEGKLGSLLLNDAHASYNGANRIFGFFYPARDLIAGRIYPKYHETHNHTHTLEHTC